jgi:hypothetical protein
LSQAKLPQTRLNKQTTPPQATTQINQSWPVPGRHHCAATRQTNTTDAAAARPARPARPATAAPMQLGPPRSPDPARACWLMLRIETPSKEPQPTHPHTHSHLPAELPPYLSLTLPHLSAAAVTSTPLPRNRDRLESQEERKTESPAPPSQPDPPPTDRPTSQAVLVAAQRRADHHPTDRHAGPHVSSGPVLWSARSLSLTGGRLTGRVWGRWVWWRARARASKHQSRVQRVYRVYYQHLTSSTYTKFNSEIVEIK